MNIEATIMQATEWLFSDMTRFALGIVAVVVIGSIKGAFAMKYRG